MGSRCRRLDGKKGFKMSRKEKISIGLILTGLFGMFLNLTYEIISNFWWVQILLIVISLALILIGFVVLPKEETEEVEELKEISEWEKCYLKTLESRDIVSEVLEKIE